MVMKLQECSVRQIAHALGRAPSTVSREFRRNGYRPQAELGPMGRPRIAGGYDAVRAGVGARRVRRACRPCRKLHPDSAL